MFQYFQQNIRARTPWSSEDPLTEFQTVVMRDAELNGTHHTGRCWQVVVVHWRRFAPVFASRQHAA